MDFFSDEINRRIINGGLPTGRLLPATTEIQKINIAERSKRGIAFFQNNSKLFVKLLNAWSKIYHEMAMAENEEPSAGIPINIFINTHCAVNHWFLSDPFRAAFDLIPVVTPLDKALWYGAFNYWCMIEYKAFSDVSPLKDLMFACIYLLDLSQKAELQSGKTISFDELDNCTNILAGILCGFSLGEEHLPVRNLTEKEHESLVKLNSERESLCSSILEERRVSNEIAKNTEQDWELFIHLINDLSEKESDTISQITRESASAKDKLDAIKDYNSVINDIENNCYKLAGQVIDTKKIFRVVDERMEKAPLRSCVCSEGGNVVPLFKAILELAENPKSTYNYLFMSFHELRMSPNKETAKKFASLAVDCIKKNLGDFDQSGTTIDDYIHDFYLTVTGFVQNNKESIDAISFDSLQPDSVSIDREISEITYSIDSQENYSSEMLQAYLDSDDFHRRYEEFVKSGRIMTDIKDELVTQGAQADNELNRMQEAAKARQIILSLNIIYLFCDAIRIMLLNKQSEIMIEHPEDAKQYRRELTALDQQLVQKVYSHMGPQEIGMLEYREKAGVDAKTLSDQETQEEAYRNNIFSEVFKEAVEKIVFSLEKQSVDDLFHAKKQIREEILSFPDCDEKSQYALWLDSISGRIGMALTRMCQEQKDVFDGIRSGIFNSLGRSCEMLPQSAINALTTAEMLYGRYANKNYAEKGFDFSCISALYYQAFEDAYNDLIWSGYAEKLNSLSIHGCLYCDILQEYRSYKMSRPDAKGYLPDEPKTRAYYVRYYRTDSRPKAEIKNSCMYKSFAILLQESSESARPIHFCEHIARIAGYCSAKEMFDNKEFMAKYQAFSNAVNQSVDNRNNASHGGTYISIMQCSNDKRIVLDNLEAVRKDSFGLIQQLLFLLNYKKTI